MQKFDLRGAGFSDRVLEAYARAGLPEAFTVRAAADATEILLYGVISPRDITAKDFVRALAQAGDGPVTVRINSPGGDVFEAMAIYNSLKARPAPVRMVVDGVAASAASFIAMAGDKIEMQEASMLMIHRPWGMVAGNAQDLRDTAATLDKLDAQYADVYSARTGRSAADMMAAMQAETWLTSSEAVANGWATGIVAAPASGQVAYASAQSLRLQNAVAELRAALPDYDPDGDGDNDAQEALTLITAAMDLLGDAAAALNGTDDDAEAADEAGSALIVAQTEQIKIVNPDDKSQYVIVDRPSAANFKKISANDNDIEAAETAVDAAEAAAERAEAVSAAAEEVAAAAREASYAARLRRLQLARIDVV